MPKKIDLDAAASPEFLGPSIQQATQNQEDARVSRVRRYATTYPVGFRPVVWGLETMVFDLGPILIRPEVDSIVRKFTGLVDGASAWVGLALVKADGLTSSQATQEVVDGATSFEVTLDVQRYAGWYNLVLLGRTEETGTTQDWDLKGGTGNGNRALDSRSTIDVKTSGITLSATGRYLLKWIDHSSSAPDYIPGPYPSPRHIQWWRDDPSSGTPTPFATTPSRIYFWPPLPTTEWSFTNIKHAISVVEMGTLTLHSTSHAEVVSDSEIDLRAFMTPGTPTTSRGVQELVRRQIEQHRNSTTIEHCAVTAHEGELDYFGSVASPFQHLNTYSSTEQDLAMVYLARRDRDQVTATAQTGTGAGTETTTTRTTYLVAGVSRVVTVQAQGTYGLDVKVTANAFNAGAETWTDDEVSSEVQALGGEGFYRGVFRSLLGGVAEDDLSQAVHLTSTRFFPSNNPAPVYQHLSGLTPARYVTPEHDLAGWRLWVVTFEDDPADTSAFRRLAICVTGQDESQEGTRSTGELSQWIYTGPITVYVSPTVS